MKYVNLLVVVPILSSGSLLAQASECRVTQALDELASIRAEAQVAGDYAQGWLLEKPGPEFGPLRCMPTETQGLQRCTKHGSSSFITFNKERELVSGLIIEGNDTTEFLIKPDGQFECASAPALNDHDPDDSDNKLPGGIIFAFTPAINAKGACEPERVDIVDTAIDGKQLFAIRGDARYTMPTGITNIPFQSVHKYPDQSGFSDTDSIIGLNYEGECKDLTVDIKIKYCEYYDANSREKSACPDIQIKGSANFAAINIERRDHALAK